jgi:hypothetical protein
MALQFDGSGFVEFIDANFVGDFEIHIDSFQIPSSGVTEAIGGDSGASTSGLIISSARAFIVRLNATNYTTVATFTAGTNTPLTINRTGTTLTITTSAGAEVFPSVSTATYSIDQISGYNGGLQKLTSQIAGTMTFTGGGIPDRSYDFDQAPGDTIVPEALGGRDGTLTSFTSGGFISTDMINILSPDNSNKCKKADINGDATFTVSGTYALTLAPDEIEYSFDDVVWSTLDAAPAANAYSGNVVVNGQQTIYVRAKNSPSVDTFVSNVTSGFTLAAMFQSNEGGRLENNQTYAVTGGNPTPMMYKLGVFSTMTDPTSIQGTATGSLWPLLAQKYSDAGVPIIVANVAQGGTSLSEWQKGHVSGYYDRITDFSNDAGGLNVVVGLGGETDSVNGESTAQVTTWLNDLVNDLNADFGVDYYQTYFPVGDGLSATPTEIANVRAGFDSVISSNVNCRYGGDLQPLDIDIATYPGNDGVHLYSDTIAQDAADIRYAAFTSSILTVATTGAPDGTYETVLWDDNRAIAYNGTINVVSDSFTVNVTADIGSLVRGAAYDNLDPSTLGMWVQGTTV